MKILEHLQCLTKTVKLPVLTSPNKFSCSSCSSLTFFVKMATTEIRKINPGIDKCTIIVFVCVKICVKLYKHTVHICADFKCIFWIHTSFEIHNVYALCIHSWTVYFATYKINLFLILTYSILTNESFCTGTCNDCPLV